MVWLSTISDAMGKQYQAQNWVIKMWWVVKQTPCTSASSFIRLIAVHSVYRLIWFYFASIDAISDKVEWAGSDLALLNMLLTFILNYSTHRPRLTHRKKNGKIAFQFIFCSVWQTSLYNLPCLRWVNPSGNGCCKVWLRQFFVRVDQAAKSIRSDKDGISYSWCIIWRCR